MGKNCFFFVSLFFEEFKKISRSMNPICTSIQIQQKSCALAATTIFIHGSASATPTPTFRGNSGGITTPRIVASLSRHCRWRGRRRHRRRGRRHCRRGRRHRRQGRLSRQGQSRLSRRGGFGSEHPCRVSLLLWHLGRTCCKFGPVYEIPFLFSNPEILFLVSLVFFFMIC